MTGGCNHPPTHLIMAKEEKWSHFMKCQKLCIFNKTRDKTLNCSAARHLELRGLQDRRLEDLSAMVCATHSFDGGICIFLDGENFHVLWRNWMMIFTPGWDHICPGLPSPRQSGTDTWQCLLTPVTSVTCHDTLVT